MTLQRSQVMRLVLAGLVACFAWQSMVQAAAPTFVGRDHVKDFPDYPTTSPTDDSWRDPAVAKPLDADGDDIYGTDGWTLYQWLEGGWSTEYDPLNTEESLPAYLSSVGSPRSGWGGNPPENNYGTIDDPVFGVGFLHASTHGITGQGGMQARVDTVPIHIDRNAYTGPFRLGVTHGNGNEGYGVDVDIVLGADDPANTLTYTHEPPGVLHVQAYHLVDIPEGKDDITVWVYNNTNDNPGIGGFFYDHTGGVAAGCDADGDHDCDSDDADLLDGQDREDFFTNTGYSPADFDLNDLVSAASDGGILLQNLGQMGGHADGDADGDGEITASGDGAALLEALSTDSAAVPEPGTLLLAALALLGVAGYCRKRS